MRTRTTSATQPTKQQKMMKVSMLLLVKGILFGGIGFLFNGFTTIVLPDLPFLK